MKGTSITYYQSLNRDSLVLGVEKTFLYLSLMPCLLLAFSARFNLIFIVIGVLLFIFLLMMGRRLAKLDKQMLVIFKRHIHLKKYYPPISGVHAPITLLKPSVSPYAGKRVFK
jgi:CcmD family protein